VAISCLVELLIVIPEESKNRRIGLHPARREQYLLELKESFHFVLETLQRWTVGVSAVSSRSGMFLDASALLEQSKYSKPSAAGCASAILGR